MKLFAALVLFRILNALFVRGYFNPDEYWQGPEVAHNIVYGYGYLTWEWQNDYQIRGFFHPMIFAVVYKILYTLGLDSRWLVAYSPRILQGIFAAIGDFFIYKLARNIFGVKTAKWVLFCQLLNWFNFYCSIRTYSNSLESTLTSAALYFWDFTPNIVLRKKELRKKKQVDIALILAALTFVVRPANVLLWVYLGILYISQCKNKKNLVIQRVIPISLMTLFISICIDRFGYGNYTFVPYNFFKFNILEGNDSLYGVHPWHWYFSQGYPAILGTMFPLFLFGVFYCDSADRRLFKLILWGNFIYSFAAHKEFRFVLPLLPLGLIYSGYALSCFEVGAISIFNQNISKIACKIILKISLVFIIISNCTAALYLSRWHQSAPLDVMDYLADQVHNYHNANNITIDFLMSCHSTPYYSHLHKNISIWFPDCSPRNRNQLENSESYRLNKNPLEYVRQHYTQHTRPYYIVTTSNIAKKLEDFFVTFNYQEEISFFHAHLSGDRENKEIKNNVLIFRSN